jgi:hypothetical protein
MPRTGRAVAGAPMYGAAEVGVDGTGTTTLPSSFDVFT